MKKEAPIYSVVDLETTGTNIKNGDRIIQIGCVLVQAGKIINRFETKINPRKKVPHQISLLTGIKTSDVAAAPLFEDVAATLVSLLSGTIFVAHNVNFDFPFLNEELARVGEKRLRIPAIDTVTLSQLLLPTARSYRLRDLSARLAIEHDHPHSAVSDAEATAQLLIDLLDRLAKVPTLTLEKLVALNLVLPQQTAQVFTKELATRRHHPRPLDPDRYYVSHGLVLRQKPGLAVAQADADLVYPSRKRQKERLFAGKLDYRPVQAKMMNAIYNYFTKDNASQVMVEAGTGVGKTLGYLLPLTYLTYPEGKVIVATPTNLLQAQLKDSIGQLNALLPVPVRAVMVKGNRHYLSLSKFAHSLSVTDDSRLVQFLKGQLLIWLLSTTTGDLDELNFSGPENAYLTEIRHTGLKNLATHDPFYQDDFLVQRQRQLRYANVVITNQAYLVEHAAALGKLAPASYLVVDEAHHLASAVLKQSHRQLSFAHLHRAINQLAAQVNPTGEDNLYQLFSPLPLGAYNLDLVASDLGALKETVADLEAACLTKLDPKQGNAPFVEQALDNAELSILLDPANPIIEGFEQELASLQLHFSALSHLFASRSDSWLGRDRYVMNQFASQLRALAAFDDQLHAIKTLVDQQGEGALFWLTVRRGSEKTTLQLTGGLLAANHYLSERVYAHFSRLLFVGATLFSSKRSAYIYDQLDLKKEEVKVKRLPAAYDFAHQAELLVASDAPAPQPKPSGDYLNYLAKTIRELAVATNCQTIVLFNSLQTIAEVYSRLRGTALFDQRDILAQGIDGSREKLLKQFSTGHNTVLLGAASFWEGIDLPNNQLQLLVVTRLPFEAPDQLVTKARYALLKQAGQNPFYHHSLPQATLRLRQGIGRLLRTPDDYGVAVVLDPRLATHRYGKTMENALPPALVKQHLTTPALIEEATAFLARHQ